MRTRYFYDLNRNRTGTKINQSSMTNFETERWTQPRTTMQQLLAGNLHRDTTLKVFK